MRDGQQQLHSPRHSDCRGIYGVSILQPEPCSIYTDFVRIAPTRTPTSRAIKYLEDGSLAQGPCLAVQASCQIISKKTVESLDLPYAKTKEGFRSNYGILPLHPPVT